LSKPRRLLITDLDNTLYDWVGFFAPAFKAMCEALSQVLDIPVEQVLDEAKQVHLTYGSIEHPFSIFNLASVRSQWPNASPAQLKAYLDEPLHRFNSERKRRLCLYEGVEETLKRLTDRGVRVVGHTEASPENAYYRLHRLGVARYFSHLYALEGPVVAHPDPERVRGLAPPSGFVVPLMRSERKPNPDVVMEICATERIESLDAAYIGDSLSKDVAMARAAGIYAVWARYGTLVDPDDWRVLVRVTPWREEDVRREETIKRAAMGVTADLIVDDYSQLLAVFQ
jgi:phosphoglycolate phosphatase